MITKEDFSFIFPLSKFSKLTMENALKSVSQTVIVALQLSSDQVKEASYQSQTVNENNYQEG